MFSSLMASKPTRERNRGATTVSLALHASLIAAAVWSTTLETSTRASPPDVRIIPLAAPAPRAPAPAATAPTAAPAAPPTAAPPVLPPVDVPSTLPPIEPASPVAGIAVQPASLPAGSTGDVSPGVGAPDRTVPTGNAVRDENSVDVAAALRANPPLPRYPEALRAARIEGGVRVRFIVGTDGRVEPESVQILESTHPAFSESVRRVLPQLRFRPARAGGLRVRQLVEIPFGFTLERP